MAKSRNRITSNRRTPSPRGSTTLAHIERPMFYGGPDPITLNKMHLVVNEVRTLMREQWDRSSRVDPRRDLNAECGYPENDLTPEGYYDLIAKEPVAELVNAIYPIESWKTQPKIYDSDDPSDVTPFMEAIDALPSMMGVEPSYHVHDAGSILWPFLLNADILAGYYRYGIIFIGVNDGVTDLTTPIVPKPGMQLTFLQAFPEHLAKISTFEMNRSSPRYGMPTVYMLQTSDPHGQSHTEVNAPYTTEYVHWSRVIHVVDRWHTASSSRLFGVPRCRPVLHPILDIKKVRGASAEMYYKGAFFGLHFGTHPQLGPDADVDRESLEDMYEEYINGLQRAVFTSGMFVDPLSPTVVGPKEQIEVQLEAISIKTRIPKRVLMGSERGELSSADDRKDMNGKLISRQLLHNGPSVAIPFFDRLINIGVLPQPRKPGYRIWWPDLASLSESEKADILLKRTQSYGAFVSQGVEAAIPLRYYMTGFDQMSEEEAESIITALQEGQEGNSETAAPLLGLVGGVDAMLQMFDRFAQGAISEETLKQLIMLFYKVDEAKAEEIIAEGLPEPPPGSERDLPPLPPMKGKPGMKALPPSKSPIVANWLVENVFCPTGAGGGIDPTCSPGGTRSSPSFKDRVKSKIKELGEKVYMSEIASGIGKLITEGLDIWADKRVAAIAGFVKKMAGVDSDVAGAVAVGAWAITGPFGTVASNIAKKGIKKIDDKLYERIGDPDKAPLPTSGRKGKNNQSPIEQEPTTGPKGKSKKAYRPNVEEKSSNGVTKAARVGVPADSVPPPPKIGELPNLTKHERRIERTFRDAFNKNPDKLATRFLEVVKSQGGVPTFGTDDAKVLHPAWGKKDMPLSQRSQNRATLNNALHQTANAIAKRAFLKHLDSLKPGDEVLVTVGGCGAGKGYALKNVPQALEMKKRAKAVWDSAGDQNATENPWIQKELEKRGLKGNYVYVHADPYSQWADPQRGVVKRAADPSDGRMVDAKVFADSYALGAKNHKAFYDANINNPNAKFVFLSNIGKPVLIEGIPDSALKLDRIALGKFAVDTVNQSDAPAHIKRGATQGLRIWGEDD